MLFAAVLAVETAGRLFLGNLGETAVLAFFLEDGRRLGLRPGAVSTYDGYLARIPEVTFRINELGFRGPARPREKAEGLYRVALLGDSFTFGQGVEEEQTAGVLLEERFAGTGARVEVLNFGVPGANLGDLVQQYPLFIEGWRPDLLIYVMSPNDLEEPMFEERGLVDPEWIVRLFRESYTARLLLVGSAVLGIAVQAVLGLDTAVDARLEELEPWLGALAGPPRSDGVGVAVLILGNPATDASTPELEELLSRHDLHSIDATGLLEQEDLTIPGDGHLNAAGHRRLADLLLRAVRSANASDPSFAIPPGSPPPRP